MSNVKAWMTSAAPFFGAQPTVSDVARWQNNQNKYNDQLTMSVAPFIPQISVTMEVQPETKYIDFEGEECGEVKLAGDVNLTKEQSDANINLNIRRGLPQLKPHAPVNDPVVICAGGPSLKRYLPNVRKRQAEGRKIVSVNGTHNFLIENGINPSIHIQLDGRPFMSRFVENPIDGCAYFMASHSDPCVFDALEDKRAYIFHTDYHNSAETILKDFYRGNFLVCLGGSTVTLRAIWLLHLLGRTRQEIFGFDSCFLGDRHHAYSQAENDTDRRIPIIPDLMGEGRKKFWCAPWMVSQANEFQKMVASVGDQFQLAVYGPGLIAHMLRTGARVEWPQELGNSMIPPDKS